ncbi:MAG: hypothetical protein H6744_19100 [Deltaproteobacteria bacterium]|nr:hypothetical protein [Deltaproteobacteria bacterium]MCB9788791.1 hypothetical protein [Deltaproteobacteria bacterium]
MLPVTSHRSPGLWALRLACIASLALVTTAALAAPPARAVNPPAAAPSRATEAPARDPEPAARPDAPAPATAQPARPVARPTQPAATAARPTAPPKPAKPMVRCDRAARRLASGRRFNPAAAQRELARVARLEPACTAAPEAAYAALEAVWEQMLPDARGPVPLSTVRRELARYERHADLLQTMMLFRRSPRRLFAALRLGELNEAMAAYLDQVGTGPDTLMVRRSQPEALYDTRAVDMNEHLRLEAERAYEEVLQLTADSTRPNALRDKAQERLARLRSRFDERRAEERAAEERARQREEERRAAEGQL